MHISILHTFIHIIIFFFNHLVQVYSSYGTMLPCIRSPPYILDHLFRIGAHHITICG
ncbi:unnamed protein product, partial [Vitis vinifera]|uniref:Uncharacterized protein n=1 Tax=Vitis vinifera TaxID=29760 RepID=D7U172_VITVI